MTTDHHRSTGDRLTQIADALGVSADDLLLGRAPGRPAMPAAQDAQECEVLALWRTLPAEDRHSLLTLIRHFVAGHNGPGGVWPGKAET